MLAAVAAVAAALVVTGALSGARALPPPPATTRHTTGAIVIERFVVESRSDGRTTRFSPEETLTETSRGGNFVATYSATGTGSRAQQEVNFAGDAEQIYDPRDNTIYETTFEAIAAAQRRLLEERLPKGSQGQSTSVEYFYASAGVSETPGWTSEYAKDVRDHSYRVEGATSVDGRAALELAPKVASRREGHGFETFPTIYVSPETYAPIEAVTHFRPPKGSQFRLSASITHWLEYRVIPATAANRRLLSLTALHPTAKISHSAMAYARATTPPGEL